MATIYRCGNRRCKDYRKEFEAMDIKDMVMATGNRVTCPNCGDVAWYVRPKEEQKMKA